MKTYYVTCYPERAKPERWWVKADDPASACSRLQREMPMMMRLTFFGKRSTVKVSTSHL